MAKKVGLLKLENSVGNNLVNKKSDVLSVKETLRHMNRFVMDPKKAEPHGYITRELDNAIKSYQREHGLRIDGILFPDGKTEKQLNNDLRLMLAKEERHSPAVPPPAIEREKLLPPNIPGTNIPDEGVPESYPAMSGPRIIPDNAVKMPRIRVPEPDIDPSMEIPHVGRYAPWQIQGIGKKI